MSSCQGRECGPGLSAWWNVLPLFFANYALSRRDLARRVLGAAGSANERFHITVPGTCALCTLIIDRPRPASLGFTRRKGFTEVFKDMAKKCGATVKFSQLLSD